MVTGTQSALSACICVHLRLRFTKCLPERKVKLEDMDPLIDQRPLSSQQLIAGALESEEARRIGAHSEVRANGSDRSVIADAEADVVHHVIEVLKTALTEAETDIADVGVHIAHVVKQHAAHVVAEQRETQFRGMEQQGISAQRETSFEIAGTC